MATIPWDPNWHPPEWAQNKKRLDRAPESLDLLTSLLNVHPKLKGQLKDLTPRTELSNNTLFFSGRWKETGTPVLIKAGCTEMDYFWANAWMNMGTTSTVAPSIFATGDTLGDEIVRWFVMEYIPYSLQTPLSNSAWDVVADTVTEYQTVISHVPNSKTFPLNATEFHTFLQWGIDGGAPNEAQKLEERLDRDWDWMEKTCPSSVHFGDFHTANMRSRKPDAHLGDLVLIDPIPRIGPWVFDPAYCQVIATKTDIGLIKKVANCRKKRGLPTENDKDLDRMSKLMLGWMAVMWWGLSPQRRSDKRWTSQAIKYIDDAVSVS